MHIQKNTYYQHKFLPQVAKLLRYRDTGDGRMWLHFRIIEWLSDTKVNVYNIDILDETWQKCFRRCTREDYLEYAQAAAKIICKEDEEEEKV